MDSDYSDTESVSSTFSESMHTTDLYESLELGKNPQAYKADKNCTGCGAKFGKIGIMHARKHYCKFCYRGVCAKCSPQVAVHPVQLKKLRVCNNCCQKAVIHKFTENFKLDIDHVRVQQEQMVEKIEKSKRKKVEIEENMKELQRKHELEMEMEIKFIQIKKTNFELEKNLKATKETVDKLMTLHINTKLDLESMEKTFKSLESEKIHEIETKSKLSQESLKTRHELGEKQDERVLLLKKIEEIKQREEELLRQRKDFEKVEKLRKELQEAESHLDEELKSKQLLDKEIQIYSESNSKLTEDLNRLKNPEEIKSDSLTPNTKAAYDENEEQKISELKKILTTKKATAENLRIQLRRIQPKEQDPLDIENTLGDKSRPCVRCLAF